MITLKLMVGNLQNLVVYEFFAYILQNLRVVPQSNMSFVYHRILGHCMK